MMISIDFFFEGFDFFFHRVIALTFFSPRDSKRNTHAYLKLFRYKEGGRKRVGKSSAPYSRRVDGAWRLDRLIGARRRG